MCSSIRPEIVIVVVDRKLLARTDCARSLASSAPDSRSVYASRTLTNTQHICPYSLLQRIGVLYLWCTQQHSTFPLQQFATNPLKYHHPPEHHAQTRQDNKTQSRIVACLCMVSDGVGGVSIISMWSARPRRRSSEKRQSERVRVHAKNI